MQRALVANFTAIFVSPGQAHRIGRAVNHWPTAIPSGLFRDLIVSYENPVFHFSAGGAGTGQRCRCVASGLRLYQAT